MRRPPPLALPVAALLAAGLGVQLYFFAHYPQPVVFGDPRGYYETGQRFLAALARWRGGESLGAALDSVRGLFYLLGVGSFFALMDALRPGDFGFIRNVMAGFNTLALLGIFLLGRSLARSSAGGLLALALGVVYPAFSVQTGRLYPDPLTGCFFVWSSWLYLEAVRRRHRGWMAAAGLALCAAAFIRAQLALYLTLVIPVVLAASAPLWVRSRQARGLAAVLALALLPLGAGWWAIERAVGPRDDVIQLGNTTFKPPYPYGFWQFLEGDGWSTAYRFNFEPYYLAMVEEDKREPGLLKSRARMYGFTARWLAARPFDALTSPLNNVYRLLDRPANDYKWDYPLSYPRQVVLQRVIVLAGLCGVVLFGAECLAQLGVFFIPLSLVALHGIMFVWPRYNVPLMPIVIASAGAALARLAASAEARAVLRTRAFQVVAAAGALALLAGLALVSPAPELARGLRGFGGLALLALPFLLVRAAVGTRGGAFASGAAYAGLVLVLAGHAARDRLWHGQERELAPGTMVEQVIDLPGDAAARLKAASEAFVAFDLSLARGDTRGLGVEVNGRRYPGSALVPTMPRLPESTSTGGRDWRGYPQWWVLPLERDLVPDGPGRVTVRLFVSEGSEVRLRLDRFGAQEAAYEGPSLGERPFMVALKLEYDGDYRVGRSYALGSSGTSTTLAEAGVRNPSPAVARIRLVTLANDEGGLAWRTEPAPADGAAFVFFADAGFRGEGDLSVDGRRVLTLPLSARRDWVVEAPPWRLCRRDLGERGNNPHGAFVLTGPTVKGRPLDLAVTFRTGMSERPMLFIVDRRRTPADAAPHFEACGVPPQTPRANGAAEIVDGRRNFYPDDTGYWTVRELF